MRIKEIKLRHFKRFTDLTICGIPETAKLVVLVGPNGCGKTSIFEAFNHWYRYRGFRHGSDGAYYLKTGEITTEFESNWLYDVVNVTTYDCPLTNQSEIHGKFYFRTAHRNEPDFITQSLSRQNNPIDNIRFNTLMETETTVSENYQRIVSLTLSNVYDTSFDNESVKTLRERIIGRVRNSVKNVFEDLELSSIGDPLSNGSFFFTKGTAQDFHYKNLSAGEKAAFDLILDIIIKSEYFDNTIYCIDEPEVHMHTALQAKLLNELYQLISERSQLWIATHSIGMLNKAKELEEEAPGSVCFLCFDELNPDTQIVLTPTTVNTVIWNKFLELSFGDFAKIIAPSQIVFCEGTKRGRKYKDFDAQIYTKIFFSSYPDTSFISIGSCSEIEDENNLSMRIISQALKNSKIIKLVDRDDKSDQEVEECNAKGIKVLCRRHIECFLYDDEIITKLCMSLGKQDKVEECLAAKQSELSDSINRGNPIDDVKSVGGPIYVALKRILGLSQCGNTQEPFMRDTLAPLITPDTNVFKELEHAIFA